MAITEILPYFQLEEIAFFTPVLIFFHRREMITQKHN